MPSRGRQSLADHKTKGQGEERMEPEKTEGSRKMIKLTSSD
jgi:hypothetical protein